MNDLPVWLRKAVDDAVAVWPEIGPVAYMLPYIEDASLPAAATDGASVYYSRDFLLGLSEPDRAFVVVHEVLHVMLLHLKRRVLRDPQKWNIATDATIHNILTERMPLPAVAGIVHMPELSGLSSEDIYAQLPDGLSHNNIAGVMDKSRNAAAAKALAASPEMRKALADLAGNTAGSETIDALRRVLETEAKENRPPAWPQALADDVRRVLGATEPDRRFLAQADEAGGPLWVENYDPATTIVAAFDTSGSVDEKMLETFFAVVRQILSETQARAVVIMADCAIHSITDVQPGDDLPPPLGRGGTDFQPVLDWTYEQRAGAFARMYYCTDCQGDFGPRAPAIPTTWVVWKGSSSRPPEGYGDVILM